MYTASAALYTGSGYSVELPSGSSLSENKSVAYDTYTIKDLQIAQIFPPSTDLARVLKSNNRKMISRIIAAYKSGLEDPTTQDLRVAKERIIKNDKTMIVFAKFSYINTYIPVYGFFCMTLPAGRDEAIMMSILSLDYKPVAIGPAVKICQSIK